MPRVRNGSWFRRIKKSLSSDPEGSSNQCFDSRKNTDTSSTDVSIRTHKAELEKSRSDESYKKERDELRVSLLVSKRHYEFKLKDAEQRARENSEKQREQMLQQIQALRAELDSTSARLQKKAQQERLELQNAMNEMNARHQRELEAAEERAKKQLDETKQKMKLESEQQQMDLLSRHQKLITSLEKAQSSHEKEVESVRSQARGEMENQLRSLEEHIGSMEASDIGLQKKVAALEAKTGAERMRFEQQVRQIRLEHDREITEMLSQLDLVEAEHNEKCSEKDKLIHEKETVIAALGSEIAEAQSRLQTLKEQKDALVKELQVSKEATNKVRTDLEVKSKEMERLKANHQKALEVEGLRREKACEKAREEMIQRAEVHFAQANKTYKELKLEYDNSMARIRSLESELLDMSKELQDALQKQESRETELTEELAKTKAAMTTIEANATRKVKHYRLEMDNAQKAEKEMLQKLKDAFEMNRSVQSALAAVVGEKEQLLRDHEELKQVCEELMVLVEGGGSAAQQ